MAVKCAIMHLHQIFVKSEIIEVDGITHIRYSCSRCGWERQQAA